MFSVVLGLLSCFILGWSSTSAGLSLMAISSLFLIHQNFSYSLNMYSMGGSVSSILVFLTLILCFLAILATPEVKQPFYLACILGLSISLSISFSTNNLMIFYVFFETSLVPTLILIICWGYQPERLQAGSYMMLYTAAFSFPLLSILIWRCNMGGTLSTILMGYDSFNMISQLLFLVVYGAFLVKLPVYSAHLWLPKAHVEAPLAGSILLAGVLLKLGGYGMLLMNKLFLVDHSSLTVNSIIISVSLLGGCFAALLCLRQVDSKALVAYSSVTHMSIVVPGILIGGTWGIFSAILALFAHGFSSSALFCLASFTYTKTQTRNLMYLGGFLMLFPQLSLWWFLFCCINMAAPPTINLVSELSIMPVLFNASIVMVVVMGFMVFSSAMYNMYLYTSVNHGWVSSIPQANGMRSYEFSVLFLHFLPSILFISKMSVII